jgi:hypothetical protein
MMSFENVWPVEEQRKMSSFLSPLRQSESVDIATVIYGQIVLASSTSTAQIVV